MHTIRLVTGPALGAQAAALLHDYLEWLRAATAIDLLAEQPGLAAELRRIEAGTPAPDEVLFVGHAGDLAAGTIGLRCHTDGTGELTRLYVRPIARGQGLAGQLVRRVLAEAADRCCRVVRLETLPGAMDPAIAVYRRHGFVPVDQRPHLGVRGIQVMARTSADASARCA